jgi:hypothetical protein
MVVGMQKATATVGDNLVADCIFFSSNPAITLLHVYTK